MASCEYICEVFQPGTCCIWYSQCSCTTYPPSHAAVPSTYPSIILPMAQEPSLYPSQHPFALPSTTQEPSLSPSRYPFTIPSTTPSVSYSITSSLSPSTSPQAIPNATDVSSTITATLSTTTSSWIHPANISTIATNEQINKPDSAFIFAAIIMTVLCILIITIIGCRRSKQKHIQHVLGDAVAGSIQPQIIAIVNDHTMEIGKKGEDISHYVTQLKTEKNNQKKVIMESWWNEEVRLPMYYSVFVQHGYESLEFIQCIKDKRELSDIGINNVAHQKQIMVAIAELRLKQNHGNETDAMVALKRTEEGVADENIDSEKIKNQAQLDSTARR
eukprot:197716_1